MDGAEPKTTAILKNLACEIAQFDPDRITNHALATAKAAIADTIGVTLAGLSEPCVQILLATPGIGDGPGRAAILGTARRTSLLDAALINGTASHALDFDDFGDVLGGHQSVPLVAPLLAMASERELAGADLIAAYAVGLEVEHRFARAVHPTHYDKGWHPTATLGIFGTVAAVAHARRLAPNQTTIALALAASMASGLKSNFGTMAKPLHVGHSARSGLMAVLLAERGFTANPGTADHDQGFLRVFNGPDAYDTGPLTEAWRDPLHLDLPSLGIKQFPCCGSTHHAIAAALRLRNDEAVDPAQIQAIEIAVHARRLRHTDTPLPETPLQAKFSVQYAVARALLDGTVRLQDFDDGAYVEPPIRRLLACTKAVVADLGPWDAEVCVTLTDGRRATRRIENMVGRSGTNAMSQTELGDKFFDCATPVLGRARAERAFSALMALDMSPDMAALIDRDLTLKEDA